MKPKLVRDNIPDIIREDGKVPLIRVARMTEAKELIIEKMHEEIDEFGEEPCLEEAADIYHVFMTLLRIHEMTFDQVVKAAVEKASRAGRFEEMYILDGVIDERG